MSGGDDQAVRVATFQWSHRDSRNPDVHSLELQLTMLGSYHVESAHTSAIRVTEDVQALFCQAL